MGQRRETNDSANLRNDARRCSARATYLKRSPQTPPNLGAEAGPQASPLGLSADLNTEPEIET